MTKKKNKFLKQLVSLFAVLLLFVTITGSITATAGYADREEFTFDMPANQGLVHTRNSYLRNTDKINQAWSVSMTYSNEGVSQYNTRTLFWLGIDNPNGVNPMGSGKISVLEGSGYNYADANNKASYKYVFLYASDNAKTQKVYSCRGFWNPASHKFL